nr:MFS transporter [Lentilactobacillus otakiensis]
MKTKFQSIVLVLIGFVLGCNEFIIVGILSDVSRTFSVSTSQAGFLVTLFALIYAFSTPVVNTIISQFNRFKVLVVLIVIFIVGNTYTALAPSFNQLIISRVLTALTAGPIISLAMSFATVIVSIEKRPMLVSWIFFWI